MNPTRLSGFTCLDKLQQQLQSIYDIDIPLSVSDFVTTDSKLISVLTQGDKNHLREKLLVYQDNENLDLCLYLHEGVITTLSEQTVANHVKPGNLEDLCLAIEGISHFLYLVWRALQKQDVSLMELELQAEVDKYILVLSLIRQQQKFELQETLHERLFKNIRFDDTMNNEERFRYREANYYAAKYCSLLEQRCRQHCGNIQLNSELREFYRLGGHDKFRRIDLQVM